MADGALELDDFLSRFQLLRPQPSRNALNQRQAAVLVPIVRRPQPGLLLPNARRGYVNTPVRLPSPAAPWMPPMPR